MTRLYSPGLSVLSSVRLRRSRTLPVEGEVLVRPGETVSATQAVARAMAPGDLVPINVAAILGVPGSALPSLSRVRPGEKIERGQVLAHTSSFWGLFSNTVRSETSGTVESISDVSGYMMVREQPNPTEVLAYLPGKVIEVIPGSGVVIEARVSHVQGIFGIGGETYGTLVNVGGSLGKPLEANGITKEHEDAVLLCGGRVTLSALRVLGEAKVRGIVAASAHGDDLKKILRSRLNPASTGNEEIPFTLILTEGFGDLPMLGKTFETLAGLNGRRVSLNGMTQIRAGVVRPEIVAPALDDRRTATKISDHLSIGDRVRVIRGINLGRIGSIAGIPNVPRTIGSGAQSLVFEVVFDDDERLTIPRPNIELIVTK